MHIPPFGAIHFGTIHVMSEKLYDELNMIVPPRVTDETDYDDPHFDENDIASYRLVPTGKIWPAEAITVAVGDDSFHPGYHLNHTITSGLHQGKFCLVDGKEEKRLVERTQDIAGSANDLGMAFEDYWKLRNKRLDEEYTRLIEEAEEAGTLNVVTPETAFERLQSYLRGLATGTIERLAIYRD